MISLKVKAWSVYILLHGIEGSFSRALKFQARAREKKSPFDDTHAFDWNVNVLFVSVEILPGFVDREVEF